MSMAVRSGTCHCPSASMRNPSLSASNNSVTSRTCFTSSRDSINMALLPLSFLLLNAFDHTRRHVFGFVDEEDIHALQWIDDEICDQTEFVILPLSRFKFERHLENLFDRTRQDVLKLLDRILFKR